MLKEILTLIEENEENAKQGAVTKDVDDEYKRISEQINELKKAKLKLVRERNRLKVMDND